MLKKNNNIKDISLGMQIAFATSSGFLILSCIFFGYFIGKKYGEIGILIGIVTGFLFGMIVFFIDLLAILNSYNKTNNKNK